MSGVYLNAIVGGVLMGVVYALIATGLTIIFGVMRIVNFAHGEMVVAGMYIGYLCQKWLGLPAMPAALVAAIIMFAFGYALQLFVVNRFIQRPQHAQFILFIGFALAITGLHLMIFGADSRSVDSTAGFDTVSLGPLRLDLVRLQAALCAAVVMAVLAAFLRFSIFGQAIRAAADNLTGAAAIGLRIPRVFAITSGIGVACAGVAGALITPIFDTQPFLAVDFTLLAFITVIVGGLGSLSGALLGGILIGASESIAALLIAPAMKSLFSYALLLLVILLRPQGLFGARDSR
jgi:branched-chain amino acid transport system permease protein